jgi:seryl-tRNA synthetase
MIDFKALADNLAEYQTALDKRGGDYDLKSALDAYTKHNDVMQRVEVLRAKQNKAAKEQNVGEGAKLKSEVTELEKELVVLQSNLTEVAGNIPNLPLDDVPAGGEEKNEVIEVVGEPPVIENPKDHIELGTNLNILDIERGVKTSGARFYFLKNEAVELEFALVRFAFDILKEKGFELMVGPQLVQESVMMSGGYLGKNVDEIYKTQDDLYLIGTSEQSMLGYHMDEMIEVPKLYASFSTCFRREAGSHGKDVKGIIRTHQFDKVEMFAYTLPEESAKTHEFLVSIQEDILKKLEIPYQKVLLAAGDMSSASAKTIDLESWLPSQDRYRETHSCSNCTDWQARRANIRYEKGKYVHTLNGTAMAIGRLLVALWENHQQEDGSIKIPQALHPYLSFKEIK